VLLAGSARFRVEQLKMESGPPPALMVQAGGALVASVGGLFDVTMLGDTTFVQVIDRQKDVNRAYGLGVSVVSPEVVVVANRIPTADQLVLKSGELGRVVRGHKPELLRRAPVADPPRADTVARSGGHPTRTEERVAVVRAPATGITISKPVSAARIPDSRVMLSSVEKREQETHTAFMRVDVVLSDGTHARLDSGAIVQTPLKPREGEPFAVTLQGSARFVAVREPPAMAMGPFAVATRTAYVATQRADFTVTQRGDTVDVEVFQRKHAAGVDRDRVMVSGTNELTNVLMIEEGQRARSVAGKPAVLLPPRSAPDSAHVEVRKP
jgi:ferric-dicitrate binding protein FerR (iron transport regulator)